MSHFVQVLHDPKLTDTTAGWFQHFSSGKLAELAGNSKLVDASTLVTHGGYFAAEQRRALKMIQNHLESRCNSQGGSLKRVSAICCNLVVHVYIYMCVCCLHVYMYRCIYIYIHTYIHTYKDILCVYIYIWMSHNSSQSAKLLKKILQQNSHKKVEAKVTPTPSNLASSSVSKSQPSNHSARIDSASASV